MIHHINKLKNKNHMIISINAEKASDKIQHPFIIIIKKNLSRKFAGGIFLLNIIKATHNKPRANIILNSEKLFL